MTALNILDALKSRLENTLKDFPLKTSYNNHAPFKVFRHKIPERLNKKFDYSKKDTHDDVYPFCVIKIDTGEKENNVSMEESVFNVVIGVKNEGHEGEGYDDVMACIQAIWNDFNEDPLLERKYKFNYPIKWAIDDGEEIDTHPFYYGVIQLRFKAHSMQYIGREIR